LIIVGEEVGVAGVWLTGIEYRGSKSTRHKVISVEPKGVDAASGVDAADQRWSVVEGCRCYGLEPTQSKVTGVETKSA
jgi:hypothetical protein